jgi:hypothetical protein
MARDIFSIPGISAEVEQLFSNAKLFLPPSWNRLGIASIKASEYVRSWVKNRLILGDYFKYLLPGIRRRELIRYQIEEIL